MNDKCLILLWILLLSSCSEKIDDNSKEATSINNTNDSYIMAISTTGWNGRFIINDQPVMVWDGGESGFFPVTTYIVNGKNHVKIKAERDPEKQPNSNIDFQLIKRLATDQSVTELGGLLVQNAEPNLTYEESIEFDAEITIKWPWQGAEDIGELAEDDRSAIIQLIQAISESLKEKDLTKINLRGISYYPTNHPRYIASIKLTNDIFAKVFQYDDFGVKTAPLDTILFDTGTKIVMAYLPADFDFIISAGHTENLEQNAQGTTWSYSLDTIFFIKTNGKWYWLYE